MRSEHETFAINLQSILEPPHVLPDSQKQRRGLSKVRTKPRHNLQRKEKENKTITEAEEWSLYVLSQSPIIVQSQTRGRSGTAPSSTHFHLIKKKKKDNKMREPQKFPSNFRGEFYLAYLFFIILNQDALSWFLLSFISQNLFYVNLLHDTCCNSSDESSL